MLVSDFLKDKNLKEMAKEMEISPSLLSRLKHNDAKLSDKMKVQFKELYGVDLIQTKPLYVIQDKNKELKTELKNVRIEKKKILEEKESLELKLKTGEELKELKTFLAFLITVGDNHLEDAKVKKMILKIQQYISELQD